MLHQHHYTLEQASAVREWVTERIDSIRRSQASLVELGAHALSRALNELDAVDVVVRDVERGLVDFPALRDGEEVYLCWLVDEDEIGFWHAPDAGFAGRRPL
jgi:hypothetical protein